MYGKFYRVLFYGYMFSEMFFSILFVKCIVECGINMIFL